MHRVRSLATLLVLALPALVFPRAAAGQASPYVPADDAAYEDLRALAAAGWVREILQAQRLHSRAAFARFVAEARAARDRSGGDVGARFLEALARLERRFGPDGAAPCPEPAGACPVRRGSGGLRWISMDATAADSPPRRVPTSYSDREYIDAGINPLLQGNQGRVLADGLTAAVEGLLDVVPGTHLAAQLHPRVSVASADGPDSGARVTLVEGYARLLVGKVSLDVGRLQAPRGHARGA